MDLRGVLMMVGCMHVVPMSDFRVMGRLFVGTGLMVLCRLAMMFGRLVVVMSCFFVMFVNLWHCFLPVEPSHLKLDFEHPVPSVSWLPLSVIL
jgi:hypothetical protein